MTKAEVHELCANLAQQASQNLEVAPPGSELEREIIAATFEPRIWALVEALQGVESTYVFLDSVTAGWEPQHTNTVAALAKVRAALASLKERHVNR